MILRDERKERLGGKEERKGGREGRLGKESDGRKWWNVEKGGKEGKGNRLPRRERVKGRVGMLEKRMEGRNKVEAGRNGNDGRLSWKGRVGKEGKGEKREKVVERS